MGLLEDWWGWRQGNAASLRDATTAGTDATMKALQGGLLSDDERGALVNTPAAWLGTDPMGKAGRVANAKALSSLSAGLDMSPEARAARAAEQGFDPTQTLYHGTGKDFAAFDNAKIERPGFGYGHHVAESPTLASKYAEQWPSGQNVMPLYMRKGNIAGPDVYAAVSRQVEDDIGYPVEQEIAKRLMAMGYETIEYKHGRWGDMPEGSDTAFVALKPENLRSVNAAFDPARANDPDLLAAYSPNPLGGLLAPQPDDKRKR